MVMTISKINSVKTSIENRRENPCLGDKSLGIDPAIRFYELEDGDNNE